MKLILSALTLIVLAGVAAGQEISREEIRRADVPGSDWAALDAREHAYSRHDVSNILGGHTAIYQADPAKVAPPSTGHPILLSYLDVVVQGFLQQYGERGVADFFASTDGWGPIKDDRADPYYPRFQTLTDHERALVDHHVNALG